MCNCGNTRQSHQKLRDDQSLTVQAKPRCAERGSESVEHSALNWSHRGILCGADVTFKARISLPESQSELLKILPVLQPRQGCGAGIGPREYCSGPEFRSLQGILLRAGAPAAADTSLTQESKSEPQLPQSLDLVTAGRYIV